MPRFSDHWKCVLLFAVIVSAIAGCAGKDDVSPVNVEEQAFADLRSEIRQVIDDPAREAEAITLVDTIAEDLERLRDKISERRQRVRQLNADFDTTRADFEAFFDQVDSDIRSNKRQVLDKHRAFLAITTPDERSAISKIHTKAVNAAIRSIQAV